MPTIASIPARTRTSAIEPSAGAVSRRSRRQLRNPPRTTSLKLFASSAVPRRHSGRVVRVFCLRVEEPCPLWPLPFNLPLLFVWAVPFASPFFVARAAPLWPFPLFPLFPLCPLCPFPFSTFGGSKRRRSG